MCRMGGELAAHLPMSDAFRTFICIYLVFFVSGLILQMDEPKEFLTQRTIPCWVFFSFFWRCHPKAKRKFPSAGCGCPHRDLHLHLPRLFVSGLTLRTDQLESLTRRTIQGTIFGFLSIVGLTPLLAYAVRDLPFSPQEFSTGLAIFCLMPTTLGVGVSLVTSPKVRVSDVQFKSR
jgi:predicted Na+-dependent transporter